MAIILQAIKDSDGENLEEVLKTHKQDCTKLQELLDATLNKSIYERTQIVKTSIHIFRSSKAKDAFPNVNLELFKDFSDILYNISHKHSW